MRFLPAQKLQQGDYEVLEQRINDLLWELIYKPIVKQVGALLPKGELPLNREELLNSAQSVLTAALKSGAVQMVSDLKSKTARFVMPGGKSSRALSDAFRSFGATLDHRTGAYTCPLSLAPGWASREAAAYALRSKAAHDAVKKTLTDLEQKIEKSIDEYNLAIGADHAVEEITKGWKDSAATLSFVGELSEKGKEELAKGLARNAKIPVKEWAHEAIDRMREQVESNAAEGYRAEGLARRIREEYGCSVSKANLIALQETSNFMAAYRSARAQAAGLRRYKWVCTRDNRVRKAHKEHNGRIFEYSKPPIVDPVTGRRGNPGQDFRCRCSDQPVIEGVGA